MEDCIRLKRLFVTICILITFANAANALPKCVGSWSVNTWHNCFGIYTWTTGNAAGNKYLGEHKNGKAHGWGTYIWKNGGVYTGGHKEDKAHGLGVRVWSNGDAYIGYFKDDKRDGQGIYTWINGSKYVGEYKNGRANGQGTYYWKDGSLYDGEHKNDKRDGLGTYFYKDGNTQAGMWKANDFLYSKKVPIRNNSDITLETILNKLKNSFNRYSLDQRKTIQLTLNQQNLYFGNIDGVFGPITFAGVHKYADNNNIAHYRVSDIFNKLLINSR